MMPFLGIEQSLNAGFSLDMSSDRFTGKPYSSSIGLYYDLHRWYDPSIGRFISPDPKHGHLSNPQSLNLYIYVVDRPTSLTDPTGLDACGWNPLSWGGCVNNAGQAASNWWNSQDQDTKIAIILVVATVAIVATAGLAAPAVLPTVLTGIAIGATTSTATYAATTVATGGTITAKGLFTSAAVGAFLGAATAGVGSWLSGARAGASASASLESIANSEADTGATFRAIFLRRIIYQTSRGGSQDIQGTLRTRCLSFQIH